VRGLLRLFACASPDRDNKSLAALRTGLGECPVELLDQIPFKSQNRYSAACVRAGGCEYTLVLGACEALSVHLAPGTDGAWEKEWRELLPTGLRLLMFADAQHRGPFGPTLEGGRAAAAGTRRTQRRAAGEREGGGWRRWRRRGSRSR